MFGVPPPVMTALRRVRYHLFAMRLWTCCAGRAETWKEHQAAAPEVPSVRFAAVRVGVRPYQSIGIAPLRHLAGKDIRLRRRSTSISGPVKFLRTKISRGRDA
jgi:hypothetical protein